MKFETRVRFILEGNKFGRGHIEEKHVQVTERAFLQQILSVVSIAILNSNFSCYWHE